MCGDGGRNYPAYPTSFLAIAVVLIVKAMQPGPVMPRWVYWAYASFIFCCGATHVLEDVTLWFPIYRLQAIVLGVTALVSLFTAVLPVMSWLKHETRRGRE